MTQQQLRWGIIGTGAIADVFAGEVRRVGHAVTAVCSRSAEAGASFARRHAVSSVCTDLAAFSVAAFDAAYVASPHALHVEQALVCMRAGKAVLCEKPLTTNVADTVALIACARRTGVFLMEGLWQRFLPVHQQVRRWLTAGRLGQVCNVQATFGFVGTAARLFDVNLGGGALLDIGIYPLDLALCCLGGLPEKFESTAQLHDSGVDAAVKVKGLVGRARLSLHVAITENLFCGAHIRGTDGEIDIEPRFHEATGATLTSRGQQERFAANRSHYGLAGEIAHVGECLTAGKIESPIVPWRDTLALAQALAAIRRDWFVRPAC